MRAVIYDGHTWETCTPDIARAAMQNTSLSWIDIRLDSIEDDSASQIFDALGVDAVTALSALRSGRGTDFTISSDEVSGSAWLAGDNSSAPTPAQFVFDTRRLVTIRVDGDSAFSSVQSQLQSRSSLAINEPSRILGFVLQSMQTTVQQALADMSIRLGILDLEVITSTDPSTSQNGELVTIRQQVQPFATRFPAYAINVRAALLDSDTITVMDQSGIQELQSFATMASATVGMVGTIASEIRNAVQDLQGQVSNWQGNRINQLTIVTIIFLPVTFLTGYFGMNFQWIDNLIESEAAFIILGIMLPFVLVAGSITWLIRRGFRISLKPGRTKDRD